MEEVTGRVCNSCGNFCEFKYLFKKSDCKYGYAPFCLSCKLIKQQEYRKVDDNFCTKKYEKTINGYLMRTYRNMKSRVTGVQHKKAHLYLGLDILDKESFYAWSLGNEDFHKLFNEYKLREYEMKYAPSIDRKDTTKGYILDNIRWITHSLNSKLGASK